MKQIYLMAAVLLLSASAFSQGSTDYGAGLKVNLKEDGSKYLRIIAWNQIWMRSTEMNPGTMINGEEATSSTDIANRRLRILMFAQISPRYMILTHIGVNNQTFTNGGANGTGGTGGFGQGKNHNYFFMMLGTNMQWCFRKRIKSSVFRLVLVCTTTWGFPA